MCIRDSYGTDPLRHQPLLHGGQICLRFTHGLDPVPDHVGPGQDFGLGHAQQHECARPPPGHRHRFRNRGLGGLGPIERYQDPSGLHDHRPIQALWMPRSSATPIGRETAGASFPYSALIGMGVPFAAGVLGIVTVSRPFLKVAVTLLASTPTGRRTLRVNAPYERSTRWYCSSLSSFSCFFSPLIVSRFSRREIWMSFWSIPETSTLATRLSLVSEMSMLGAQSPTAGSSSHLPSNIRSNIRSISCLRFAIPVHGVSARIVKILLLVRVKTVLTPTASYGASWVPPRASPRFSDLTACAPRAARGTGASMGPLRPSITGRTCAILLCLRSAPALHPGRHAGSHPHSPPGGRLDQARHPRRSSAHDAREELVDGPAARLPGRALRRPARGERAGILESPGRAVRALRLRRRCVGHRVGALGHAHLVHRVAHPFRRHGQRRGRRIRTGLAPVSYTHLRAHETPEHLVCRLLLEK